MSLPLTITQAELVRANLGLIGLHLRRAFGGQRRDRRDREFDDLFQEGCLGLMRAARKYDPACGMTFATFALPRIRQAVSRSVELQSRQATGHGLQHTRVSRVRQAEPQTDAASQTKATGPCADFSAPPSCASRAKPPSAPPMALPQSALADQTFANAPSNSRKIHPRRVSAAVLDRLVDSRPDAPSGAELESLGDRMWLLYSAAIREAASTLADLAPRSDRASLLRALVEERLLIRRPDARRPLRQIARELHSSYGRVVQCERQVRDQATGALRRHPEFLALCFAAESHDDGVRSFVDDAMERFLAEQSAQEFVAAYAALPVEAGARFAHAILSSGAHSVPELLRTCVRAMNPAERDAACRAAWMAMEGVKEPVPRLADRSTGQGLSHDPPRAPVVGRPRRAPSRRHDPDSPTERALFAFHSSRPHKSRRSARRRAPA